MMFHGDSTKNLGSLFATSLLALAIAGCGSSSDNDNGSTDNGGGSAGPVSLSEEEQVMGAALTGVTQAGMAQGFAEGQAEPQSDPADGSSGTTSMSTTGFYTASNGDEVAVVFKCPSDGAGSEFSGEGEYRFEGDDDLIDIHNLTFPDQFSNADALEGQGVSKDALLRADCVVTMDGEEFFRFKGSLDVAQQEDINGGRVVVAKTGGYTGPEVGNAPDLGEIMESAVTFDDEFFESRFRTEIHACEGCVDGNLNDFTGNPALDALSVAFMDMTIRLQGFKASFLVGQSRQNPFVMKTAATGTPDQAAVELDGLLKFEDLDTGCGFDVTYETVQALLVNEYSQEGEADTVGGEMNVTLNETGNIYNVQFQSDGAVRVFDQSGSEVTPDPSADAQSCGYFIGDEDSGGSPEAAELEGTWVSECTQVGASTWSKNTYSFLSNDTGSSFAETFDNDSCSGSADDSNTVTFDYVIGGSVGATNGVDAFEIDMTNRQQQDPQESLASIYEIYGIDNNTLYFGEPDAGPSSPADRPENLDLSFAYTKQ